MKKRIFSAIAALAMLLCSCSWGGFGGYENVGPSSSSTGDDPNANYSNYEFGILVKYATDAKNTGVFEGERNSAAINTEIANRNSAVEKSFNIKIKEYVSLSPTADIDNALLLDEKGYDMVYASSSDVALLLSGGRLIDLADFSAFELEKSCFDSSVAELSVAGKTFALAGDFGMGTTYATSAVLVNNALVAKLELSKELGKTLPELVEDGEWTLDTMKRLSLIADTAGANEKGEPNFSGFSSSGRSALTLLLGFGAKIFENDEGDIPSLNVQKDSFSALFDKISDLAWSAGEREAGELFGSCYNMGVKSGEALFTVSTLGEAKTYADRGLCFSLLPMPKLDADQSDYISRVQLDKCELAAIPATTSDLARSAAVLTALFSDSGVKRAYLRSLETECTHDYEKMIETIVKTKHYELGDLFGWGDFGGALSSVLTSYEPVSLEETLAPRALAAEKALDIVLKRLLGENYKDNSQ